MKLRLLTFAVMGACSAVVYSSCGGESSSPGGDPPDGGDSGNPPGRDGSSGGDGGGGGPVGGGVGNRVVCANREATASQSTTLNMITMFDHSGSMGNIRDAGANITERWFPVVRAMTLFMEDPVNAGVYMAAGYFPLEGSTQCRPEIYKSELRSLQRLPSPNLKSWLDDLSRNGGPVGDSTVLPALEGAMIFAQAMATARPADKTIVLLITDGLPPSPSRPPCSDNTYANIEGMAAKGLPSIPTFVMGVGPEVAPINKIAAAGGTQTAIWVERDNPRKTSDQLTAEMSKLRQGTALCQFSTPIPNDGKTLDFNAIDVTFTASNLPATKLPYNAACDGGQGFRFDNPQAPTRIDLCPATCDVANKDKAARVSINMACVGN